MYFSDRFGIERELVEAHGAFDVCLIADVPLFIDPFLVFNSNKSAYQALHRQIVDYLLFVHDKVVLGEMDDGLARELLHFPEVRQNWLGYCKLGNRGRGLGSQFAESLRRSIHIVHPTTPGIQKGLHLERLCLVDHGVGRDSISDFTTNLCLNYFAEFTQALATDRLQPGLTRGVTIDRARFNYSTESWEAAEYQLPWSGDDFVLLTPMDMLTKDEAWINRSELVNDLPRIINAVPNEQLRAKLNNYLRKRMSSRKKLRGSEVREIHAGVIREYPEVIDYYIAQKEARGGRATVEAAERVGRSHTVYVQGADYLRRLLSDAGFYEEPATTYESAMARVLYFKDVIENKGGHRVFYVDGEPLKKEEDVQIVFRFTWFGSRYDVSREVNDGRGPADYKVSLGAADKSLIEFKLARNSRLRQNLASQAQIYQKASDASRSIHVILCFSAAEQRKVQRVLKELKMENVNSVVVIDARKDNKPSGSRA